MKARFRQYLGFLLTASAIGPGLLLFLADSRIYSQAKKRDQAEEVIKAWSYPGVKYIAYGEGFDTMKIAKMNANVDISYRDTFEKVVKFYSNKCGLTRDYCKDDALVPWDRASDKNGKAVVACHHFTDRDIDMLYGTDNYTINISIRPERRNESVAIILSIAVR